MKDNEMLQKKLEKRQKDHEKELLKKDEDIQHLKQNVLKAGDLASDLTACKQPSLFYTLYLREQGIQFQLERIVSNFTFD